MLGQRAPGRAGLGCSDFDKQTPPFYSSALRGALHGPQMESQIIQRAGAHFSKENRGTIYIRGTKGTGPEYGT
jgi:hypothetical protein